MAENLENGIGNHHDNPPLPDGLLAMPEQPQYKPWFIPLMVVANVVMFGIALWMYDCPSKIGSLENGKLVARCAPHAFGRFSFPIINGNLYAGAGVLTMIKMGAWRAAKPQLYRLFTAIWLHKTIFALIINQLSLLVIGIIVEMQFGFVRTGAIFLLSGIGGTMMYKTFPDHYAAAVAASAPLFGLMASMISELFTNWSLYNRKARFMRFLLILIIAVINMVNSGFGSTKLGGTFVGFCLGAILLPRYHHGSMSYTRSQISFGIITLMLLVVVYIPMLLKL